MSSEIKAQLHDLLIKLVSMPAPSPAKAEDAEHSRKFVADAETELFAITDSFDAVNGKTSSELN